VQDCPRGYPLLAAFLDSDENFMVYRRFGFLHSRILLKKQEQLRQLEQSLDRLDQHENAKSSRSLVTMEHYDGDEGKERRELEEKIEQKLLEYGQDLRPDTET